MNVKGNVHKYGDHVDTDVIIPARYLNTSDVELLTKHCMEDIDENFINVVKPGDILVAGKNFGCGSSREHAPMVIKHAGISCVIATSFARIFFRNAINIGLPVLECEAAVIDAKAGDEICANLTTGEVTNVTQNKTYNAMAFPEFMQNIIDVGGLVNYTKKKVAK